MLGLVFASQSDPAPVKGLVTAHAVSIFSTLNPKLHRLLDGGIGLLKKFTRQGLFRRFPGFNAAAGQLALWAPFWIGYQEDFALRGEGNGVNPIWLDVNIAYP